MDFSKGYRTLTELYSNSKLLKNRVLRLDFVYNKALNCSLLYTNVGAAGYDFVAVIRTDGIDYPLSYHVNCERSKAMGEICYSINPYIKFNYSNINGYYRSVTGENLNPSDLFAYINDKMSNFHVLSEFATSIGVLYKNAPAYECPYYKTYRRANMSKDMRRKIRDKYINAEEIIDFFSNKNHCTLVFTSDPFKAKELKLEL